MLGGGGLVGSLVQAVGGAGVQRQASTGATVALAVRKRGSGSRSCSVDGRSFT